MINAFRRVALGLAVVCAASATLLLSDLQHRQGKVVQSVAKRKWRVFFVQFNDVIDVEEAAAGVMSGFRESGLREGTDFEVKTLNAQGDMATVSALIDAAITEGADMLVTFSTPTLQAAPGVRAPSRSSTTTSLPDSKRAPGRATPITPRTSPASACCRRTTKR